MNPGQGVNREAAAAPGAARRWPREAAALILLGAVLFGWRLGGHDLWPTDEPRFGLVAREMRDRGDAVVLSLNDRLYTEKPPLFFWLVNGAAALRGSVDEWAARAPSAAAGVLALLLILHLGETLYDRRTGALAAVVFATSVQILERARWASIDMTLNLFVLLAIVLLWRAAGSGAADGAAANPDEERRARWSARLAWLSMGLATLAKGPVGMVLPLLAVVTALLLVRRPGAIRRVLPITGIALFLLVTLAWFVPFALRLGPPEAIRILTHQTVDRYVDAWNGRQPFWFYAWRFPVGFFPWVVFLPWAIADVVRNRAAPERRAGLFLLAWAAAILLFFSFSTGKRGVYVIPAYPAAALLVARFLARLEHAGAAAEGAARTAARTAAFRAFAAWAVVALATAAAVAAAGPRRAPELLPIAWLLAVLVAASGPVAMALARRGRAIAAAAAVALAMAAVQLVAVEAVFPYINRHLNLRGFAEKVRDRTDPSIPLATTEEKRDAWVFYGGRFVEEVDTPQRLLAYLARGPVRDLLIEDEGLRSVRDSLPPGTVEILTDRVSGRPYHLLRLPISPGGPP